MQLSLFPIKRCEIEFFSFSWSSFYLNIRRRWMWSNWWLLNNDDDGDDDEVRQFKHVDEGKCDVTSDLTEDYSRFYIFMIFLNKSVKLNKTVFSLSVLMKTNGSQFSLNWNQNRIEPDQTTCRPAVSCFTPGFNIRSHWEELVSCSS